MGLGANFIIREVPSSANIYANCHYIYQDTFSTYDTQFIETGNRFPWRCIVFSLPDSIVSS